METLRRFLSQLATIWKGMSPFRRVLIASVAALTIGLSLVLVVLAAGRDYQVLYSNLSPEESGNITSRLKTLNIPYKLEGGGTTIRVPGMRLAQVRVDLAAEGIPVASGKGFELFDGSSLGTTPFVQNVNYLRALQAELARSISQLDPVAQARVHIVQPERSPFVREQKATTASVVLKLKSGAKLTRNTADGIVALVARAVEGLTPENVTLVDTRGQLLTDPRAAKDRQPSGQDEYRHDLENYLANQAQDILRRHLGSNRVIVRVTADVNFQHIKEKSETVRPEEKAVISERVTTSSSKGAAGARGVAGAASNVGRTSAGGSGGEGSSTKQESVQTDFVVSKTSREQEDRLNKIQRLTVAAIVDLTGDGGDMKGTQINLANVESLIKQAVGFKEGRDTITVTDGRLPGDLPPAEETPEEARIRAIQAYVGLARNVAVVVGLFLLLLLGILVIRRFRAWRAPTPAPSPPATAQQQFADLARNDPERTARVFELFLGTTS